ncbi:MAG: DNA N-6-adenine-methyltransferase [Burkholderiaceae bacterium]|nr:DNA N-6-adenine-methyltransferase [Burkholderiaceae bacterium]
MSIIQTTGFDYSHLDPETRIVVRQKTDELKTLLRAAAQNIFDIGARLTEVRDQLRHNREGGFEGWLSAEFGMSPRTAYRFINVFEQFSNSANLAELDIAASALYLLAAPSTPDDARQEALRRAEDGERITHHTAQQLVKGSEPELTEADIAIARDLVAGALIAWARPVNRGSIYNQVQRLDGGAHMTRQAVYTAIDRMIAAGNVLDLKDEHGRRVHALAHDPAIQVEGAGETTSPVAAELSAKFDRSAITILGRSDDGAEHRAVDVARKLVTAGIWNGSSMIEFDAYAIHDKLFGVDAVDPHTLTRGKDRDIYISGAPMLPDAADARMTTLQALALDRIVQGPLTLAQLRARLGIKLGDQEGTRALRDALAALVAGKQLRQVRDMYFPPAPAREGDGERGGGSIGATILDALAEGPLTIQDLDAVTRLGMHHLRSLLPAMIDHGHIAVTDDNRYTLPPEPDLLDDYARYQQYEMPAADVADFLARYYKTDRYTGRGADYAAALLKSYEERFEADGFVIISHHDSRLGEIVSYYGKPIMGMDALLDQPVSRPGRNDWERQLPPTQTSQDADRILALLRKHAPVPLRMHYIREQLDLGSDPFLRARMLLAAYGAIVQSGESLALANEPEPKPTVEEVDAANGFSEGSAIPYGVPGNSNGMAVHYSSESAEWYTPADIIERAVVALTGIDLDPCSNSQESPNVPAAMHYTRAADGLAREWQGKVYMNPPYGREIGQWVEKLVTEYRTGRVTEAIALVPARTDTAWFAALRDFPRCFVSGRLTFRKPDGSDADPAPFPSAVVYLGSDVDRFAEAFAPIGDIYVRYQAPKEEGGVPV